jgi:hypothetical protein
VKRTSNMLDLRNHLIPLTMMQSGSDHQ